MMARSTAREWWRKHNRQRSCQAFLLSAVGFVSLSFSQSEKLLDQAVAVVGRQVLTLRDLTVYVMVTSTLNQGKCPSWVFDDLSMGEREKHRQSFVRSTLICQYLDSLGLFPDTGMGRKEKLENVWMNAFSSPGEREKRMKEWDVRQDDVDHVVRNQIRSVLFMDQHLSLRSQVTEEEVKAHYEKEKNRSFLGKPFSEVGNIVRAEVVRDKLEQEFQKWLETEMRRTEVVLLPLEVSPPSVVL